MKKMSARHIKIRVNWETGRGLLSLMGDGEKRDERTDGWG